MAADAVPLAPVAVTAGHGCAEYDIVLKPITHPELGDIRIDESLFAIGRTEPPFGSYMPELVADLSRRHARIFSEYGAVYLADLGSKNGTTVNGANIQQKITRLQHGDEISFGRTLSYRVQLGTRAQAPGRAAKLLGLTLTPERNDLGLQPIVVTQFPFLISKADETFSRYKEAYPHQVNYISRRHAHIFLKGGAPFVEDLGSTNGTFVAGKRLDEHAVPLQDDDLLAFGGHHFVYKVSLQKEEAAVDPTVTKLSQAVRSAAPDAGNADKTTFVAAADSFLNIFCVDQALPQDDEVEQNESKQSDAAGNAPDKRQAGKRQPRGKVLALISGLTTAFLGNERNSLRRGLWWGAALVVVLAVGGLGLYLSGASGRELQDLLARGDYAQAAVVASQQLESEPENVELKTLATEALLKAKVPQWLALLNGREYERAAAILADMKQLGRHNAEVLPLVSELEWIGNLEKFVLGRGGVEAPIRMYSDEDRIKALLRRWDDDPAAHQRAFATISSHVPPFKDTYAEALSHLRKLQSDDAVYLAAIERLKATLGAELNRDQPQALEAVLNEYAEKYPRIGGLDEVRRDLRQYLAIDNEARANRGGPLIALLAKAKFSTPPFQERFHALLSSRQLPSAELIQQYAAVSRAWRAGDTKQTFDGLQKMAAGPGAEVAARQLEHKKAILDQFGALQKARGAKDSSDYEARLLAFYTALDPDEDAYFIRATETDLGLSRDKIMEQAQERLKRAQTLWRQYRDNGAIEGTQRLETTVSSQFRTQAKLLTEALDNAQQGVRLYTQSKADIPPEWRRLQDELNAEAELQRKSLQELRNVLAPGLWKAKLALLGGRSDEER
jgi:pSer/pThr/pTyr-binding forkhead associated (FHA) protein